MAKNRKGKQAPVARKAGAKDALGTLQASIAGSHYYTAKVSAGMVVVGGKQNRTVNVTILVPPGASFTLPVSCVESGRWQDGARRFQAGYHAPPSLRGNKLRSVHKNRSSGEGCISDQNQVWDDVACCLADAGAVSDTSSLTDGYAQTEGTLSEYREHLPLPDDASGVMVFHGREPVGLDLFDHHATLAALWPRLSEAYFLGFTGKDEKQPAADAKGEAFLRCLGEGLSKTAAGLGLGQAYEISSSTIVGGALWYKGHVCHASAFPSSPVEDEALVYAPGTE